MEKFSAYRDPGTGIQPFLTPVPPNKDTLTTLLLPFRYVLGIVRSALIILLLAIYIVPVRGLCSCLTPLPFLHRLVSHCFTFILGRTALFLLGLFWIPVELVSTKRRRGNITESAWNPRAGDIIVSNWVSWVELVWLAVRFNPMFIVPVPEHDAPPMAPRSPAVVDSGRHVRTTTRHMPQSSQQHGISIIGFRELSLLSLITVTGHISSHGKTHASLEDLRKKADRPIVVFPECTTSNGRSLLRFSNLFHQNTPVRDYRVFLMCVRYDSPSSFAPSPAHPIPSSFLNPLPHVFKLSTALKPLTLQIRFLVPSESPSSPLFLTSEVLSDTADDQLAEASAVLISRLSKLKRINLGWEEKATFLEFYHTKSK